MPTLSDLLATARVVALPLVTRFRGIDVREALLLEGPRGWT
ncbi:MAG: O-succinylbenzoate synthase, partial [Agromyces sp.]|nr:O-succinylbenzoate synthase [Agromyces sp.]